MKLATLQNHTRDGQLVVVNKAGSQYASAEEIAPSLQWALDHWDQVEPKLKELAAKVEDGRMKTLPVDTAQWHAPLPRAYEWIDGSAYINHIMLVRKARGAEPPATLRTDPLVYQGGSGVLLGPKAPIVLANAEWGCDFESEICVILGDTPQGTKKSDAHKYIRLVLIANDVSLRNLIPEELAKGFGFFNSKPATAFSPFAVTPDDLGTMWKDGRLHATLKTWLNDSLFGDPNAGPEMHFSFYDLIEHICKTRAYTAGTILGSGTVSNEDRARGSSCIQERRMIEKIDEGTFKTPFLKTGDKVVIEAFGQQNQSIFGRIEQSVVPFK